MLKLTNKFFNQVVPPQYYKYRSGILASACREGSLWVLGYLYSSLRAKFQPDLLVEANREAVGVFAWIADHLCSDVDPRELVDAYSSFAVHCTCYEAAVSAYQVIKSKLPLSKSESSPIKRRGLMGGLSPAACLCLYDRFGHLDFEDRVMPSWVAGNIFEIARLAPSIVSLFSLHNVFDLVWNNRDRIRSFRFWNISVVKGALHLREGGQRFIESLLVRGATEPDLLAVAALIIGTVKNHKPSIKIREAALKYARTKIEITNELVLEAVSASEKPLPHLINEVIYRGLSLPADIFKIRHWSRADPDLCLLIVQHGGLPDTSKRIIRRMRREFPHRVAELQRAGFR